MQFNLRILSVLFLLAVLTCSAMACSINIDNLNVEVRSDGDYDTSITAQEDADIDVKITFDIDSYSGSDCPSNITVKSKVTKYDEDNDKWVAVDTDSESKTLDEDSYVITFSNQFNTGHNSNYTEFNVEGILLSGSDELETENATVDVENSSCDGIKFTTSTITMDEDDSTTKTFVIENSNDVDFRITNADLSTSSSLITSGDVEYPEYVDSDSEEDLDITLVSRSVSSDSSATVYLEVEGYLGDNFCSVSEIGKEKFTVKVENNSSSDDDDEDDSSSDCDDILIQTRDTEFEEGTTQKLAFDIENNSTKRFEVLSVETNSTSFTLSKYFNEKYIFPGNSGDLILSAVLPNVTQSKTMQGTVKIRGVFSDGRTCSYSQIGTNTFDVNVLDSSNSSTSVLNCKGLSISVPSSVTVENYGKLNFTITNASNRTARITVEGTIDVSPTVIVLPKDSSLSKEINVVIDSSSGVVRFVPQVEGCTLAEKVVTVTNTASGALSDAKINVNTERDYNTSTITLAIEVDNPTNKIFEGTLNIDAPNGWPSIKRNVTVVPGANNFTEKLGSSGDYSEGKIKVSFISNGKTISDEVNTNTQEGSMLAGLFAFGSNMGAIGIILLIILIVIILVGMVDYSSSNRATKGQDWVDKKN